MDWNVFWLAISVYILLGALGVMFSILATIVGDKYGSRYEYAMWVFAITVLVMLSAVEIASR
jgi:hypothetical protein